MKLKDLHKSSFSSREELDKSINKELEKEDEIQDKQDHHKSKRKMTMTKIKLLQMPKLEHQ